MTPERLLDVLIGALMGAGVMAAAAALYAGAVLGCR